MAFGITPKHIQELSFEGLTQEQTLAIGIAAATKLGWSVGYTSPNGFIAYTSMSLASYSEEVSVKINVPNVTIKSECTGSQLVDWGKNKKNVEQFVLAMGEVRLAMTPEELTQGAQRINFTPSAEGDPLHQPHQTSTGKIKGFFSIFIPTDGYYITPIVVNLNIIVFILMIIAGVNIMLPDTESLIAWGANFRPSTLDGQPWRLLTSCFLHIGIFHLLMNLYALVYIGLMLEPRLGKTRFLTAYILAGIAGSATSLYWHDLTVSAGASGAIFGMYGVFLAMLTTNLIEKTARRTLLTSIMIFVGYNLLNGLKGGIDNAAHLGGLISGIAIGYAFYPSLSKPSDMNLKHITAGALTAVIFLGSFLVYQGTPNDIGMYDARMKKFVALEEEAMEVYHKDGDTPKEELLAAIKDHGIANWKASIQIIQDVEKLNLPDVLRERNKKLLAYCELRVKSYELLYKAIDEDSDLYQKQLQDYNDQIETIIKELTAGN